MERLPNLDGKESLSMVKTTTRHTSEPWQVNKDCGDFDTLAIYDPKGKKIVFWGGHYNVSVLEGEANVNRIVACVNACKGINPEAVSDLLQALNIALAQIEEWRDESLSMGVPNEQIQENSDTVEVMLNATITKAGKEKF